MKKKKTSGRTVAGHEKMPAEVHLQDPAQEPGETLAQQQVKQTSNENKHLAKMNRMIDRVFRRKR